jgi:hypothetical protein
MNDATYIKEHKRLIKLLKGAKEKPLQKEGMKQAQEIKDYLKTIKK